MSDDDLPIVFSGQRSETAAMRAARGFIEGSEWIFRPQDGRDDFGIDAELEIATARGPGLPRRASGRLAKAQVRGRSGVVWVDGGTIHKISRRTFNLWRQIGLPVFIILWDVDAGAAHWATPYDVYPSAGNEKVPIVFRQDRRLEIGIPGLAAVMDLWRSSGGPAQLGATQAEYENFQHLQEATEGSYWLSAGPDLTGRMRRFLAHVDGLALALGIVRPALRSMTEWLELDRLVAPEDHDGREIHYGTLRLAMGEASVLYLQELEAIGAFLSDNSRTPRDFEVSAAGDWLRYVSLDHAGARFDREWAASQLQKVEAGADGQQT